LAAAASADCLGNIADRPDTAAEAADDPDVGQNMGHYIGMSPGSVDLGRLAGHNPDSAIHSPAAAVAAVVEAAFAVEEVLAIWGPVADRTRTVSALERGSGSCAAVEDTRE
jgi:hypothetical protein